MPKVSEEHKAARREEIARAALRCFATKGYAGTSMADIIRESGLSAGAIYGYYRNKNELVREAMRSVVVGRFTELERGASGDEVTPPGDLLVQFLRSVSEVAGQAPGMVLQVWSTAQLDPELKESVAGGLAEIGRLFRDHLERWYVSRGVDEQDARIRAAAEYPVYVGVCQGYIVHNALVDGFDGEAYFAAAAGVLAHGASVGNARPV
ncbi:TetR/AcrR family transcriptional regulator [Mumia sp. Pv 4-285]|uniref:TetR/AcrR family transcriptional regulator n=1 Tax=Mumia qirimensis TaxID=3234852 RepID=UPI00351D5225